MKKKEKILREKEAEVIELYEKVAIMRITPNQARVAFMKILSQALDTMEEEK